MALDHILSPLMINVLGSREANIFFSIKHEKSRFEILLKILHGFMKVSNYSWVLFKEGKVG